LVPPRHGPLLYPEGDTIAAALAARLVALSDEPGLTIRGVRAAAIDSALARDARGAVLPIPKRTLEPCRELGRWPPASRIVPLIESRASAVVRRGVPALSVEYDGTLRPAQVP
jgi:pyrimidine deaminase RibD-like protein